MKHEKQIICDSLDGLFYVTDRSWQFVLDDEKPRQFGIVFRVIDMFEATGEDEFKDAPFLVDLNIVPDQPHSSMLEPETDPQSLWRIYDVLNQWGGVSCNGIVKAVNPDDPMPYQCEYSRNEYRFKNEDDAEKFMDWIIKTKLNPMRVLIGFILDQPYNRVGTTGWEIMASMACGTDVDFFRNVRGEK